METLTYKQWFHDQSLCMFLDPIFVVCQEISYQPNCGVYALLSKFSQNNHEAKIADICSKSEIQTVIKQYLK